LLPSDARTSFKFCHDWFRLQRSWSKSISLVLHENVPLQHVNTKVVLFLNVFSCPFPNGCLMQDVLVGSRDVSNYAMTFNRASFDSMHDEGNRCPE